MLLKRSLLVVTIFNLLTVHMSMAQVSQTLAPAKTKTESSSKLQTTEAEAEAQAKAKENSPPPNEEKPALAENRLFVKNGKHFLVLDTQGMISGNGAGGFGLYADDTRYLSNWQVKIDNKAAKLLSANTKEGFAGKFIYSNLRGPNAAEGTVLVQREITLRNGMHERISLTNYSTEKQAVDLSVEYGSDFADMFEVRGSVRRKRGTFSPVEVHAHSINLKYTGLDGIPINSRISGGGSESLRWEKTKAITHVELPPGKSASLEFSVQTQLNDEKLLQASDMAPFAEQLRDNRADFDAWKKNVASVTSANATLNALYDQAIRDLYILRQPTPKGWCIAAGLPWFAVAFGRDELITAWQTLPVAPDLARDVLRVLANYQGKKEDAFTEERKGKIMHELRLGEMARCKEIPFIPYYGTVDATPLFLVLLGRYVQWTGDEALAKELWPHVKDALSFLEQSRAGSYLQYGGSGALSNQGWKDSGDSIMYSNGELVKSPVSLCEVQGYLYESWKSAANLAAKFGEKDLSEQLHKRADSFREQFQKDFWMADKNTVALALDGSGKQCDVVASNAGHLLGTGILSREQEQKVAERLIQPDMFCGWGVRTLSSNEKRYNPMSYHDGSVWPHDNGIIVAGMAAIGKETPAKQVMQGMIDAAGYQPNARLPELFCGFSKQQFSEPVPYPVSCSPQAWAAGSMIQMLFANLHLSIDAAGTLHVGKVTLPQSLGELSVNGLHVGNGTATLRFPTGKDELRHAEILQKTNNVKVIAE
ncbi:MAG: hypothetical protein K2X77_06745 [Candidatus Obscuribacterales bacterium]|nr:hypothetical protein [Candidatus Obscuribacterales bacterium]